MESVGPGAIGSNQFWEGEGRTADFVSLKDSAKGKEGHATG